jgi:hypothetical protein
MNRPPPLVSMRTLKEDVVPEGWFTTEECAAEWNLSRATAFGLIKQALISKQCVMRKYRRMTTGRGLYPIHHYKFKG